MAIETAMKAASGFTSQLQTSRSPSITMPFFQDFHSIIRQEYIKFTFPGGENEEVVKLVSWFFCYVYS